ncbi:MAG: hypothetical protein E7646_00840 [Ruminococcaceae bacterium]|nr:hypothetical protein [Oscillospiraceae bacterium]
MVEGKTVADGAAEVTEAVELPGACDVVEEEEEEVLLTSVETGTVDTVVAGTAEAATEVDEGTEADWGTEVPGTAEVMTCDVWGGFIEEEGVEEEVVAVSVSVELDDGGSLGEEGVTAT